MAKSQIKMEGKMIQIKTFQALFLTGIVVIFGASQQASADAINFDSLLGPTTFAAAGPAQTLNISTSIGSVQFTGGVILTNATNLPADETSIYGTAADPYGILGVIADPSLKNPLTITFPVPITNFFVDIINGNTSPIVYTVADNAGNTRSSTLVPNTSGGNELVGFAATGTVVTVSAASGLPEYDFFIDNVHFNEPLPPNLGTTPVPEPFSLLLLASGLGSLGVWRGRLLKRD